MDIKKAVQEVLLGHDLKIDEMRKVMTQNHVRQSH